MGPFRTIRLFLCCILMLTVYGSASAAGFLKAEAPPVYMQADTTNADTTEDDDKSKDLPLEPTRHIEFSTSEGTWMSVDVSPDGKQIAFDLMGDLYLMPFNGGEATRLTEGMAFDTHPRYSPDGRLLLFTSDRSGSDNIWYMNLETGEYHQVTKGKKGKYPSAEWSPDGDYIIVSKGGLTNKLWMYHKDGGTGEQLIEEPNQLKTIDPAFGHEGRFIYYSRRFGAWDYNAQLPQYQIGVYDRENGETSVITSRYGSAFTPTLSSDGKWMVYGSRFEDQTGLIIRNLDTGNERWLAYPVQRDDQESIATMGVYPGMAFTPDNKELVAYYGGKIWRIPVNGGEAKQIPFQADVSIDLGPRLEFKYPIDDKREVAATQIRDAVPSPDGNKLAFTVLNKLYLMDYPDGTPRRLTDSEVTEAQPAWSPDGRWLVYSTWSPEGGHLYKIDITRRNPRAVRLTEKPAIYGSPEWSFNSDRIVFLRGTTHSFKHNIGPNAYMGSLEEIAWISSDGGEVHFVAKSNGRTNPHFVKNNDRIYMNRGNDLISIRWDGTDEQKHVEVTGIRTFGFGSREIMDRQGGGEASLLHPERDPKEQNPPSPASLITKAPEGDQALAKINNNIYTLTVPQLGEAPEISLSDPSNAKFPARKLTEIGGQFPAWSADGRTVHWSIGNAHRVYNLDEARAFEDSVKAAEKEDPESDNAEKENDGEKEEKDKFKPEEHRIKVTYQQDTPEGAVVFRGARIITMNGDNVINNGDLLVVDNRIKALGEAGSLDIPEEAREVDAEGKTIIPGFVDTHAHMWPSWGIHKTQIWDYAANLAYGVTTTRDPQTATTDVLTYADMVQAGEMIGPRIYSTGPGVGFWAYDIQDLDHARDVLKQYSDYYKTKYIKMYIAGNRKQRQWIIMASKEQELMPTTEGALDWKLNMTQLVDGYPGHEHSYPIHPVYREVVEITAESKMAVTPTLLVSYGGPWAENYFYATEQPYDDPKLSHFTPYSELASKTRRRGFWSMKEEHVFHKHAQFMKDLVEAGGLAGIGSHGQLEGLGYHWELWSVHSGGMSNLDALRTATILGAEALGLDGDLGSVAEGKLADLVILNENPLDDIRNTNTIEYVMKNGRLYDGRTLDEIYPRQKEAGPFWWRQEKPESDTLPGVEK